MKKLSDKASAIKLSSTLRVTALARELKEKGINVISFGPGEPDFDTPENIKQAAINAINTGFTKYTDGSGTVELRKAICDKLKRDNGLDYDYTQIIVSNGAKHSLNNIFMALLDDGDEVIIPAPFWLSYPEMVRMAGGVPVIMYTEETNSFAVTEELLNAHISPKTKAIVINSPNNPSGMIYDEKTLRTIADFAVKNDIYVISDEIYEKLIYDDSVGHISIASFNEEIFKRTIVVNGFSKSHSMTGWRIGYTASNKEIAKIMANIQSHGTSNPNSIAQKAAFEALTGDQAALDDMCAEFRKRCDYIYERVCGLKDVYAAKPRGAFYIFINVEKLCGREVKGVIIKDAADFSEMLLNEKSVAVVSCADFGYEKHIRLSYAVSIDTIKEGMDRIETFINENFK